MLSPGGRESATLGESFSLGGASLGLPSSRQDALLLIRWIDRMIEQICWEGVENEFELQQLVQVVYNVAWKELIR